MSTYAVRQRLFECIAGTTSGSVTVTISGANGPDTFYPPVNMPGVSEATGTITVDLAIPDADQDTPTLSGGGLVDETGSVIATVVTKAGSAGAGREKVYATAEAVAAKCVPGPIDTSVSGANIQITARPSIRGLFRDETEWRLPVVIRYRASMDA